MRSFAYSEDDFDSGLCYQVWYEIERLRMYFCKFCGNNAEEAMQLTLMHSLKHYNTKKGDIVPYIKALAREITKDNGRFIYCDFLEQTLANDSDEIGYTIDAGEVSDISDTVVEDIVLSGSRREEVAELALQFMNFFILLCESLINKDTTTIYFPDVFIAECLKLTGNSRNFNAECLSLYAEFKDKFNLFLNSETSNQGTWRETDFDLINKMGSKRVRLVNKQTKSVCNDLDSEDWIVAGNLNGKKIFKIEYYKVWDMMCDFIDEDGINPMKFTIDYSYIVLTLGGSLSVINPNLFNEYELCKMEILTNLLYDTYGRCLGIGSKNMYFLVGSEERKDFNSIPDRVIKGVTLHFNVTDVTP